MVATPSKLAALAALLLAAVDATSIENNPVTILEAVVPMTDVHPAYGGPVREIKPVVVPDNTDEERAAGKVITNTSAVEIRSAAYRKLEGAPTDMAKLEKYFGTKLEVNYKKLLSSCKKGTPHQIPWPSSYWPVYMDSINARWTNEASPAEKYAKAFGKDVTKFMDTVSQVNGIDGFSSYKKCTSNPDCASDGSTCAKRAGKSSGYCIPTWYGICHAWAPASNWEPEPQCDVVKNGVTFHPYDLKGLVSAIYDGAQINTVFTGTRFYGPDSPDTKDKYGRYTDAQRRDLGAGFFHIAIANIMCLQGHSFVVDVTAGAEVWNQPVSGYEVIESTIMDPAKAGKEHFGTNNYPFNDAAKYVAYTKTRFSYIIEAYEDGPLVPNKLGPYTTTVDYEYFVELDASYNVIGGEWLGDTRYNHPDFLWFATGTPSLDTVTKIGLSYKEVRALIDESVACKGSSTPAPTTPAPTTPAPTTPAPTTPAPTTPAPTTVKPTTTPAATTVKPTTTPAATTATPTSTPVATTVKPTSTPAVTTDKPSVTTPAPTDKPSVTTPAPTTDKPAGTTPAPTTASPSTGATPVPTTVAPPAGKPTPPAGKPTPAPEPSTDAPPAGKPTPPGGKPTPPAGKPTPAPEPSTASPSTGATPVPTTVAPPAGKPTPPAGKPTPPTEAPSSGGVPPPGKVTPPGDDDSSEDDDVPVPPSSGSGKPTTIPETPAVTPAVTTAAPPAGKPTPAPSATTVAPPSDDGKGTVSPPGGDDDENDDTPVTPGSGSGKPTPPAPVPDSGSGKPTPPAPVPAPVPAPATSGSGSGKPTPPAPAPAPDSGAGKPTPPAPVPAPVPAPGSGAGKPTPPSTGSDREASSGSDAPTPAPTKKNKKHKLCH